MAAKSSSINTSIFIAVLLLPPAVLCCGKSCGSGGSFGSHFPAIYNFGDSNSDTGGLVASALRDPLRQPYGESFFFKPSGRYCDGRLIIDFLLDAVDMPLLNSYLNSIAAPSFQKGCNFAVAGSTILPATATSVSPFSFGVQVSQFTLFKSKVLDLLSQGNEFKRYIPQAEYFNKGLYVFDIGQNDLAGAFYSKSEDQVAANIPTILAEFESGVKELYDEGARNFWVHNTGPLGCLPENIAAFGKDPSKLDKLGCVSGHNHVARLFNLQLHALCTKLLSGLANSSFTYVDVFSIKHDLIANYSRYGFEQPLMACCGVGGPPLNYNNKISCGQTGVLNGTSVAANACTDPDEFVNWDGIHYTQAANFHVAAQILTGRFSDPPFSDSMPFLLPLKF